MAEVNRCVELDGLRAIAVIAVVLFHAAPNGLVSGGFIGVDLFFVLSGYLITAILAAEWRKRGSINLARFYWRRFLRLMPPLALMLFGYLALAPFIWSHNHLLDATLTAAYLSDYSYTFWQLPLYLQHTWSLAVEEHFYLIWPLLIVPLLKARRPLLWLALAYLAVLAWRTSLGPDFRDYYYRFDARGTGLILGSALAFVPLRSSPAMGYVAAAVLTAICAIASIREANAFIPLAELASAALVVCAVTGSLGFFAAPLRRMAYVGRLSYGIYLWHFPIAYAVRPHFGFTVTAIATMAASLALAAVSYHTVEVWARLAKGRMRDQMTV